MVMVVNLPGCEVSHKGRMNRVLISGWLVGPRAVPLCAFGGCTGCGRTGDVPLPVSPLAERPPKAHSGTARGPVKYLGRGACNAAVLRRVKTA
ncbi:MAG: hypothetical protein H8F28_02605 [Fibrella sp.]|nr:hypothetical protein [Armatimonadota bacterium]